MQSSLCPRLLNAVLRGLILVGAAWGGTASAIVVPFTGSIALKFSDNLPPLVVPGAGIATINGSAGTTLPLARLGLPGGAFNLVTTVPAAAASFPIVDLRVSVSNGPGSFSQAQSACGTPHPLVTCAGSHQIHGRMPLNGSLVLGLFGVPGNPLATLAVPLNKIGGGSTTQVENLGVTARITGAGWTAGTATVFTPLLVVNNQAFGSTETPGKINLVSPYAFRTNAVGFVDPFAVLTLNLNPVSLPEPGTSVLLLSGAVLLAARGVRRRRSGSASRRGART